MLSYLSLLMHSFLVHAVYASLDLPVMLSSLRPVGICGDFGVLWLSGFALCLLNV